MDDSRTVWCGNLSDQVTEDILYELFLQAAPLEKIRIPTDKNGKRVNYAFITFKHDISVDYALQLLNGISLFDKNLNIKYRNNKNPVEFNVNRNEIVTSPNGLRNPQWNNKYYGRDNRPRDRHFLYERNDNDNRHNSPNRRGHSNVHRNTHDRRRNRHY